MHAFPDTDRSKAAMPADRVAALPWLIAGRLLFAPVAPRDGGLTTHETEAIEAMGVRLERDRHAGLLPASVTDWFSPSDGRTTPLSTSQAWLRARVMQYVCVDLNLWRVGRPIQMTLLQPPTEGYGARAVRRAAPAVIPPTRRPKQARLHVAAGNAA